MKSMNLFVCVFMALCLAGQMSAQDIRTVNRAKAGNADAQNELGVYYANNQNYKKAIRWWKKAAKQNHVGAQFNLGMSEYNNGFDEVALDWFRKSADGGYAPAQCRLGEYYANEKKDYDRSLFWWLKSANQGYARSQYFLAVHYLRNQKLEEAYKWCEKSAAQGFSQAVELLKRLEK